jgi:YidC/Oxa1 family membrane protein insertase
MFTTLIVQPIFNVLSTIYALIPGHDFGVAIILFTFVARFALYPLLKKQLKNTKAMRELQPELKKIKKASKGNKQQESLMMMELYKEKEIKPLSQIGLMIVQIVVFLALFSGLNRVVNNPQEIVDFSYEPVQNISWMQEVSADIGKFDETLLGQVDLTRAAVESGMPLYWPALLLVLGSAVVQFLQIRQTMPSDKNARKLRDIIKEAGEKGEQADSSEINAAMGRNMAYFMPALIFFLTIGFPAALALYWFVGGLIAYAQQARLLQQDEFMMKEAAVVVRKKSLKNETQAKTKTTTKKKKSTSKKSTKKRR